MVQTQGLGPLTPRRSPREFTLAACGCTIACVCRDDDTASLIEAAFGGMCVATPRAVPLRRFTVGRDATDSTFHLSDGEGSRVLEDADSLLFHIDKEITLALQLWRADLFFLHAATLGWDEQAVAFPASSGTGKSTFTLSLIERGFDYLSDELAPVDLGSLDVHPYPHAVNLKSMPPATVTLPRGAVRHGGRLHVPLTPASSHRSNAPHRLAALIFPQRNEDRFVGLRPMTTASTTARLMAHALNPMAHPACGLDAAVTLARSVPCFELDIHDLPEAADAVTSAFARRAALV